MSHIIHHFLVSVVIPPQGITMKKKLIKIMQNSQNVLVRQPQTYLWVAESVNGRVFVLNFGSSSGGGW